jgi:hypothetical protein
MSAIESFAITNNTRGSGGESGYIGGYDVDVLGCLISWNTTAGFVGNDKNTGHTHNDAAYVDNVASSIKGTQGDVITTCPGGTPSAPTGITAMMAADSGYIEISWTDNASNEIGFRIDKKVGASGSWNTVVYRPRKSAGDPLNEQKWRDYMAARGEENYYRVVAINCSDGDDGASAESNPVVIPELTVGRENGFADNKKFVRINPNPASSIVEIVLGGMDVPVAIDLVGVDGQVHQSLNVDTDVVLVDVSHLDSGVYLLLLHDSQIVLSEKLIISK